ncbi:MAG TPA: hypothetical protein VIU12_08580 [Chryseolinea sp.]
MIAGIVFLCLFGGIVVWMVFLTKHEKNPAQEENLNDELLYEPLTGKKITVEEAERGIVVENYEGPRIKSDQEIEENYSDDLKEIEYIHRDFIKSGIGEAEDDKDIAFDRILEQSEYAKELTTKVIHYLWEFRPGLFFGLVYVKYSYLGRGQGPFDEYQPFAVIEEQSDIAAFATIQDACVELIDDAVLIRLPKRISHAGFKEFVEDVNNRLRGGG